jgi:hypothetical protein
MIAFGLGSSVSKDVLCEYSAGCLKMAVAYFFKTVSLTHYLVLVQRDTFSMLVDGK